MPAVTDDMCFVQPEPTRLSSKQFWSDIDQLAPNHPGRLRPERTHVLSHAAVLLFRTGTARFERLFDDAPDSLDMEIHERVVVQGRIGRPRTPLIHEDFKGLKAYITRHNK